jgi:hypothetical protein
MNRAWPLGFGGESSSTRRRCAPVDAMLPATAAGFAATVPSGASTGLARGANICPVACEKSQTFLVAPRSEASGRVLPRRLQGDEGQPQDESRATYACTRLPEDGEIAGSATTDTAERLVSALTDPSPGVFAWLGQRRHSQARRLGCEHCGSFRAPGSCRRSCAELGLGAGILADAPRGQTVAGIPALRRSHCQGSGDERVVAHIAEMLTGIRCIACGEASSEWRSRCSAPVAEHQGATSATPKSGEHQPCQFPSCLRNGRLGGAR